MLGLDVEDGVHDTKIEMAEELKQALSLFIHVTITKVTQTGKPIHVVGAHSGVKISKDKQRVCARNVSDGRAEVIIIFVFYTCRGGESWGVSTHESDWFSCSVEL